MNHKHKSPPLSNQIQHSYDTLGMIVYCCSDLIFATKISSTAESLGLPSRPARNPQALRQRLSQVDDGKPHGPVTGVLIDLTLPDHALTLIQQAKAHCRDLPVVAFGSHVATALLESAREAGADFVMPRSSFTANLVDILERFSQTEV